MSATDSTNPVRASRAGDDFHLGWAAQHAMRLLDAASDLTLVKVEGVTPIDDRSRTNTAYLAADVSEYFGGKTFADARELVVSQLKYSTRNPNKSWTASRLAETKDRGASVIRRLAETYADFGKQWPNVSRRDKLQIRLVSNQPLAANLEIAFTIAKEALGKNPSMGYPSLVRIMAPIEARELERLRVGSKLNRKQFCEFINLLDLSGCGHIPRLTLHQRVRSRVATIVVGDAADSYDSLIQLVRQHTLPHTEYSDGITRFDVIAALGATSEESLFPAPPQFELPAEQVQTKQSSILASAIQRTSAQIQIAHGPGGIGKTTTVCGLERSLPEGSVVIAYDCFGGGNYLDVGTARHTPERALIQITSELSLRLATDPIIRRGYVTSSDIWSRFKRRLAVAASTLTRDALLVIAFDAADNAAFAAAKSDQQSFLDGLWRLTEIPSNVRFLVTCRTHRLDEIGAPDECLRIPLPAFDVSETQLLLESKSVECNTDQAQQFCKDTGGIPRVQSYVIDRWSPSLQNILGNATKGLDVIFGEIFEAATELVNDPEGARSDIATFFALTRPVNEKTFASIIDRPLPEVRNLLSGLIPAITFESAVVRSRDEDFETFLRNQFSPNEVQEAHDAIATYLLPLYKSDGYAARFIATHLSAAGRSDELVALVLSDREPALRDGVERARTYRTRVQLALAGMKQASNSIDIAQLLYLASIASRTQDNSTQVIRSLPELAARFTDSKSMADIYLEEQNQRWLGPAHLRIAASLAWNSDSLDQAKFHLDSARAWLKKWNALPPNDRTNWELSSEDLGFGAAAIHALSGTTAAVSFLRSWIPHSVIDDATDTWARCVAPHVMPEDLQAELTNAGISAWLQAKFIVVFEEQGTRVSSSWIKRVAKRLARARPNLSIFESRHSWQSMFCLLALGAGCPKKDIKILLSRFELPLPTREPRSFETLTEWFGPLLGAALQAAVEKRSLVADDMIPKSLRRETNSNTNYDPASEKRNAFRRALLTVLPIVELQVAVILNHKTAREINPIIRQQLQSNQKRGLTPAEGGRFTVWATNACRAMTYVNGHIEGAVDSITRTFDALGQNSAHLRIQMAGALAAGDVAHRKVAVVLLEQAQSEIITGSYASEEQLSLFEEAASIAFLLDEDLSSQLFVDAIEAAQGISNESASLLASYARVAERAARKGKLDDPQIIASAFVDTTELVRPRLSDSRQAPYFQVIQTATCLDKTTAIDAAIRWDRLNYYEIIDSLPVFAATAMQHNVLDAEKGLSLAQLNLRTTQYAQSLLECFERSYQDSPSRGRAFVKEHLPALVKEVASDSDFVPYQTVIRRVLDWLKGHRLENLPAAIELGSLYDFYQSSSLNPQRISNSGVRRRKQGSRFIRAATATDISKAIALSSDDIASVAISKAETEIIAAKCLRTERLGVLELLVALAEEPNSGRYRTRELLQAAFTLASAWAKSSTRITTWLSESLRPSLFRHLEAFLDHKEAGETWFINLELPFALEPKDLPVLIRHAAQLLPSLSSVEIQGIAELVADVLAIQDLPDFLRWGLKEFGTDLNSSEVTRNEIESLSDALWMLLGHYDTRIRWRAARVLRSLIVYSLDATGYVNALLERLCEPSITEHLGAGLPVLQMSAATMLLSVFYALVGHEKFHTVLAPHRSTLIEIATDKVKPEIAIRELARRLAFELSSADSLTLDSIRFMNQPTMCAAERGRSARSTGGRDTEMTEFHFDQLDTIPYWFEPLARVFGISTNEVAQRANRWIVDVWGFTNEDVKSDPVSKRFRDDWYLARNDHGSLPTIETLSLYLDFHAMNCVAGELLDQGAEIVVDSWEDADDPMAEWLSHFLPVAPGHWTADNATPVPQEVFLRGDIPRGLDDRDSLASQVSVLRKDRLIALNATTNTHTYGQSLRMSVSTALASKATSPALLLALQSADKHSFALPYFGEGPGNFGNELIEPGFRLVGVVVEDNKDRDGTETSDPFRPSNRSAADLRPDFLEFIKEQSAPGPIKQLWESPLRESQRGETSQSTSGHRTLIDVETLIGYLVRVDMNLIMVVNVSISNRNEYGGKETGDPYDKTFVYLITTSGRIRNLRTSRRLR